MNWLQLVFMWCGIAAILFCAFFTILDPYKPDYDCFATLVFLIALVTSGLIVSFKGRKSRVKINVKEGFLRITCLLSVLAFAGWCVFGVFLLIDETLRDVNNDSWLAFNFAFISVPVLWAIYGIVFLIIIPIGCWTANWITKGFNYEPKEPREN